MFKPSMSFTELCDVDKRVARRLAEIERDDYNACSNCGGEDCCCCEIYHDRAKWVEPYELFDHTGDPYYEQWEHIEYEDEEW